MAAPITAGEKRLGVLVVYAPKPPVFGEEDLRVLRLVADQAAIVLESRALIDEAARVRAREEVTRLKDDFLSAAAHELRTPLTTLVAGAQLLARRATRFPDRPPDLAAIQRLVGEAQRLRALVVELLDASRAERGSLVGARVEVDLVALARAACRRLGTDRHRCTVEAPEPVVGLFDPPRIEQLVENLVENAIKYSPAGGSVRVAIRRAGDEARLVVEDRGIGIPREDLPRVFDRFHRAANVDDRTFAGMGLGLFISRAIVEGHGGRISVASELGNGTRVEAVLPCVAPQAAAQTVPAQPSAEGA
jgi:signal transduction histidine kinase